MHQTNTKLIEDVKRLKEDREKMDKEKKEILERFQQVTHTALFENSRRFDYRIWVGEYEIEELIDKTKTYVQCFVRNEQRNFGGRGGTPSPTSIVLIKLF